MSGRAVRVQTDSLQSARQSGPSPTRHAFSLVDVLVTLAVIALLIGLMMPTLASVRDATRKVVCSSNIRQLGIGLHMYTMDQKGVLPDSVYSSKRVADPAAQPSSMMALRLEAVSSWDGLGKIFPAYIGASGAFYCIAHTGNHRLDNYTSEWNGNPGLIYSNYQYRSLPGQTRIDQIQNNRALVADGLATQADFNHKVGANVLLPDNAVVWYSDRDGRLLRNLPTGVSDPAKETLVSDAWNTLDSVTTTPLPPQ